MASEPSTTALRSHPDLTLIASGKVREIYEMRRNPAHLLFVATDRVSAFDVVLGNPVPNKGAVLTILSKFWFDLLRSEDANIKTHFVAMGLPEEIKAGLPREEIVVFEHRSMVVRRLKMLPIESICRAFLSGSAWSSYRSNGTVNGITLPPGLEESDRLPEVLWTPSTKASSPDEHDENITPEQARKILGPEVAEQIMTLSARIFSLAASYAAIKGIMIADTKFEFGLDDSVSPPAVVLCDEVLTPDSSRFWSAKEYVRGQSQPSLDKEPLRRWLVENGLKGRDGVMMPRHIVNETERRYKDAYERLTGREFDVN
ncbi:MAG: hypothetical protein Q9162_003868 [Coniocarpon cinnabarinum]